MRRLLFVDDEQLVLDGLRNMLRAKRRQWDMTFVAGGREAIAELAQREFDVVVSDMRMPYVDGAAVLKQVQVTQPNAVRVILSGHTEMEAALRTIPVAHQFLSKPCDAAALEAVIERACGLQSLLTDPALRAVVGGIGRLPSVPTLYAQINEVLERPKTSPADVAALIEQDIAISAKILQVVNSGFFGLPKRETNIHAAVKLLGMTMLRRVLLSVQAFASFERPKVPGFSMEELQKHSYLTAMIASRLMKTKRESEDAFTAGILHDIGKLVLAMRLTEDTRAPARSATPAADSGWAEENEIGALTHADIGAYLLGIWGLPYTVVEAVAYHHKPMAVARDAFDVVDAVYVANLLAQETPDERESGSQLDPDYLARLGVEGRLAEWRRMAGELRTVARGTW